MVLVLDSAAFNIVRSHPYWSFSSLPNFHTPHTHVLTPSPWFLSLPPPVPLTQLIPSKLVSPRSCFCTFYLLFNSILIFTRTLGSGSSSSFQFLIGNLSDLVLPPLMSGTKHLLIKAGLLDYLLPSLWGGWPKQQSSTLWVSKHHKSALALGLPGPSRESAGALLPHLLPSPSLRPNHRLPGECLALF